MGKRQDEEYSSKNCEWHLLVLKYVLRTTPRDHVVFEISLRTRRCHGNTYQDEEYSSKNFGWYFLVMRLLCFPRDDIASKVLSGWGDCIGIHIETRSTFQRTFDNISPSWNIFWGRLLVILLSSKVLSGQGDVIERRVKTRSYIQWIFINEKSSKDFSRRRVVTVRFIRTRSNLRKICQEEDLSSTYLSRRGVTSFKRFL